MKTSVMFKYRNIPDSKVEAFRDSFPWLPSLLREEQTVVEIRAEKADEKLMASPYRKGHTFLIRKDGARAYFFGSDEGVTVAYAVLESSSLSKYKTDHEYFFPFVGMWKEIMADLERSRSGEKSYLRYNDARRISHDIPPGDIMLFLIGVRLEREFPQNWGVEYIVEINEISSGSHDVSVVVYKPANRIFHGMITLALDVYETLTREERTKSKEEAETNETEYKKYLEEIESV